MHLYTTFKLNFFAIFAGHPVYVSLATMGYSKYELCVFVLSFLINLYLLVRKSIRVCVIDSSLHLFVNIILIHRDIFFSLFLREKGRGGGVKSFEGRKNGEGEEKK